MSDRSGSVYIGVIRCECGGEMDLVTDGSQTAGGAGCHTVECRECREVGGYNAATLEVFGATDAVELVGEE